MTYLSEPPPQKRTPPKKVFGRLAGRPLGSPFFSPIKFFKRILQRWKECWQQAALPDTDDPPMDRSAEIQKPAPPLQKQDGEYIPKPGMLGKNVEWAPCSPVVLDKMLDMAKICPDDYVIDPGSGDGRIVIRAAKLGARAHGIESNSKLVTLSRKNAEIEGVGERATFAEGDFFETDYSEATVITLFLRWDLNLKLRPKILDLAPGTRVVSNIFDMGDWEAEKTLKVEDGDYYFRNHTVHLWIVPAKVSGIWELPAGELEISQKFQKISGKLSDRDKTVPIEGKITGDRIDFTADGSHYMGDITEDRMILERNDGSSIRWTAKFKKGPTG